ncbi:ABC transporter permease [Aureimonas endophytica]|uniref:ABC transporter permease n=1 Tax=Aureimonas endophytica TaxID=2027858 RepID=A0A917E1B9_9HYPH|nr:MFS transporter [Aureimonas endophytica]GGD88272.1 ABC transporter permease [Aureimonas endophytica]
MTSRPFSTDSDAGRSVDWLGAGAAIASISAVGTSLGFGLPLLSVVLEERGASASMIGANTAVAGIASLAAAPLVTPLAKRIGVRNLMLLSIAAAAASGFGFYLFAALPAWFALRFVFHFAVTALFILSEFWISTAAPPHRRGMMLGLYATCLSLGFAFGPFVFSQVGSRGVLPFAIGAGVLVASAIPLLLAWDREPPVHESDRKGGFWRYVLAVPTATAAVFVFGAVESGGFALFPIYGQAAGFSEAGAAQLLTAVGLGNVFLQIPLGLVSDRVRDPRSLLLLCAVVGLLGSLALPFLIQSWWLTALVLFVWGGVVAGLYTVGLAHLGSKLSGADLASANAAFIFCYALGMLVGPQGIGASLDLLGLNGFSYALAVFFAFYIMLTLGRLAHRAARS